MPLCPKCKAKHVRGNEKAMGCLDRECGFVVWRVVAGKKLTDSQLKTLITKGKTSSIDGFVSAKTGKNFSACLKLNDELKTEFVFENPSSKKKK
jgi:DNA topoisomerase-3